MDKLKSDAVKTLLLAAGSGCVGIVLIWNLYNSSKNKKIHRVVVSSNAKINSLGFRKESFNKTIISPTIPSDIRKNISLSFPKDYKSSWVYYIDGMCWLAPWMGVFILTFYHQHRYSVNYYKTGDTWNRIKLLALSPIFGWSMCGIIFTGHDALHETFAPKSIWIGDKINKITAFICMDSMIFSSFTWNKQHAIHHKNVNIDGFDDMYIRGNNFVTEQLWVGSLVPRYWFYDLKELLNINSLNMYKVGCKFQIIIASYFRFYYLYYKCFNDFDPVFVLSNVIWLLICFNYIGLLSHSIPVRSKGQTDDYFILAMRETWDIFPKSGFMNFLHCGIGAHCSHHIFPYIPRSLFSITHDKLKELCPKEYRVIDTWTDELWLFWNRRTEM
eukprot:417615_1